MLLTSISIPPLPFLLSASYKFPMPARLFPHGWPADAWRLNHSKPDLVSFSTTYWTQQCAEAGSNRLVLWLVPLFSTPHSEWHHPGRPKSTLVGVSTMQKSANWISLDYSSAFHSMTLPSSSHHRCAPGLLQSFSSWSRWLLYLIIQSVPHTDAGLYPL